MKSKVWFALPLLLFGVSACSGGSVATTTSEARDTGLEGVEFVVHQAPG